MELLLSKTCKKFFSLVIVYSPSLRGVFIEPLFEPGYSTRDDLHSIVFNGFDKIMKDFVR